MKVKGLDISHSWVGDLQVSLSSPGGKSVRLFDRPGVPNDLFGCDGRNVQASFDDKADNTAEQLETTCNDNPGIEGSYQPLDPFALLAGEPAIGIWTLSVEDFVPEDGGSLDAWSLEVCAVRTKVANVLSEANAYNVCANQGLEFDIYLGEGFTNNINLSAEGQPTGAMVSFSQNPAAPGDTVKVTLSNLSGAGNFNLIISASDGKDTATTTVQLAVSDVEQNFVAIFPFDDATNIPVSTSLEWEAVTGADAYIITVYKVPGMLLLTDTVMTTSYFLNNLELSATYEWQIQTNTDCGLGTSELFSFSTIPNLSFSVTPFAVNACPTDKPSFNINIGAGYGSPASVTYTVVPNVNLPLTFSSDPNNVPVGTTIKATLDNLSSLPPNQYTITFRISDGTYSSEDDVTFRLRGVPAVPFLQGPVDGNNSVEQSPVLTWKSSADATSYRVEVATDDRFMNIVRNAVLTDTVYTTNPPLGGGTFYWRVTSLNDCGFSTSGIFDFFIQAAGVHEWQGQQVTFLPNPTSGQVNIVFAQAITGDVNAEIYAANGQLLKRVAINAAVLSHSLDLSDHPNGLYLIRLINGDAALTERILVQK
ncbi:MAG: proprotein convertase P-domain-containing protein [Saprospiraceae bacterium]|nr:proprotein convertase P-domain-containing protein [Saprospiraceae bacterium]